MSIQYLLDGYNIIPLMKVLSSASLEEQRLELVRFIELNSPEGSSNNSVTIVFDGKRDIYGSMQSRAAKIIFSQGESADEKIKKIVTEAKNTKNVIVVSDDRDIQYAVRALGAKISSVQAFLDKGKLEKGKKRSSKNKDSFVSKQCISKSDEFKITSELGEIWLKPNDECK